MPSHLITQRDGIPDFLNKLLIAEKDILKFRSKLLR